jgi:hypothetical protein
MHIAKILLELLGSGFALWIVLRFGVWPAMNYMLDINDQERWHRQGWPRGW